MVVVESGKAHDARRSGNRAARFGMLLALALGILGVACDPTRDGVKFRTTSAAALRDEVDEYSMSSMTAWYYAGQDEVYYHVVHDSHSIAPTRGFRVKREEFCIRAAPDFPPTGVREEWRSFAWLEDAECLWSVTSEPPSPLIFSGLFSDRHVIADTGDTVGNELRVMVNAGIAEAMLCVYEGSAEAQRFTLAGQFRGGRLTLESRDSHPAVRITGAIGAAGFEGDLEFILSDQTNASTLSLPRVESLACETP